MAIKKENPELLEEMPEVKSDVFDEIDELLDGVQNDEEDYIMHEEDVQDDEVEEYEDV